jgi:hypothetical protein
VGGLRRRCRWLQAVRAVARRSGRALVLPASPGSCSWCSGRAREARAKTQGLELAELRLDGHAHWWVRPSRSLTRRRCLPLRGHPQGSRGTLGLALLAHQALTSGGIAGQAIRSAPVSCCVRCTMSRRNSIGWFLCSSLTLNNCTRSSLK